MRRDFLLALAIVLISLFVWRDALFNFFAQDDFIFIEHFSQNNLIVDLGNTFGKPEVTHWRPLHNLYFLVSGNIFGKDYFFYHALTLAVQVLAAFFIFKVGEILTGNRQAAVLGALFYAVSPAHFVSMFWVAGGATAIGFLFLILSFWSLLTKRRLLSAIFFIIALLASEAMLVGIVIFAAWILSRKSPRDFKLLSFIVLVGIVYAVVKLLLTSPATYAIYKIELATKVFGAFRYYILRILGFAEVSGDKLISIGLLAMWIILISVALKLFWRNVRPFVLPAIVVFSGFFPFVLIPSHLSAHYMNISTWGLAIALAILAKKARAVVLVFLALFTVSSIFSIDRLAQNHWVTKRSEIAKTYLGNIEKQNPTSGTKLIFGDSSISDSKEAYIALGQGQAIKFWFDDRYGACFTFQESCPD